MNKTVCPLLLFLLLPLLQVSAQNRLSSNGITWTFRQPVQSGTFLTGDPWVIGPVEVIGITNSKNDPDFTPRKGQNGSMVNPLADRNKKTRELQGYDDGIASYRENLNAGLPNGKPVSPSNPLRLSPGSTLISSVSWLYRSPSDAEPGTPRISGSTNAPRPVTRSMGLLTVLKQPPPVDSFRPPYAGDVKDKFVTVSDIHWDKLADLSPPSSKPDVNKLISRIERPWVDHVFEWMGAMIHPSEHMPNYGRDMGNLIADATLLANTDLPQAQKRQLVVYLIQYGIDLTGIADFGGGWRANGGHGLGRKWPILFTGLLLENDHMMNVGYWDRSFDNGAEFQEDQNYFYVSSAEVSLTNSSRWAPDSRNQKAGEALPYGREDIGLPEWGIRHAYRPESDNKHMAAKYREVNGGVTPGFALAALMMRGRKAWNHEPFFDYQDRYMAHPQRPKKGTNAVNPFISGMWNKYRELYPPVWTGE